LIEGDFTGKGLILKIWDDVSQLELCLLKKYSPAGLRGVDSDTCCAHFMLGLRRAGEVLSVYTSGFQATTRDTKTDHAETQQSEGAGFWNRRG
jgi:hypothetical protein